MNYNNLSFVPDWICIEWQYIASLNIQTCLNIAQQPGKTSCSFTTVLMIKTNMVMKNYLNVRRNSACVKSSKLKKGIPTNYFEGKKGVDNTLDKKNIRRIHSNLL